MEFQCQKLFTDVVDISLWWIFSFGVDLDNNELYKPTTLVDKIFTPETHLHFKRVYMKLFFLSARQINCGSVWTRKATLGVLC